MSRSQWVRGPQPAMLPVGAAYNSGSSDLGCSRVGQLRRPDAKPGVRRGGAPDYAALAVRSGFLMPPNEGGKIEPNS